MKKSPFLVGLGVLVVILAVFLLWRNPFKDPVESKGEDARQAPASVRFVRKKAEQDGSDSPADSKSRSVEVSGMSVSVGGIDDEETQKMMTQMRDAMAKRNEAKAAKLIAKWSKEMNLSPSQIATLEEHFAEQVQLAGGLMGGEVDHEEPMASLQAVQHLEGKGLGALMDEILTPEQKEIWDESEKKQQHRAADTGALQKLASLNSVIEVREEQREAIYDHFYQKRLAIETDPSDKGMMSAVYSGIANGFGVEMNPSGFLDADFTDYTETVVAEGGDLDVKELVRKQREIQIENQVSELEPILDAEQLESYREHLNAQGALLDSFINVSEHDSISIEPTIVEPED